MELAGGSFVEIECNRKKDTGNGLTTLNGESEPFHSEFFNSE